MARILILANHDLGLYNFRKELVQEMLDKGNEVYVSLPNGEKVKNLTDLGCSFIETKVDRRGLNPIKDLGLLFSYSRIFKKVKPDMIITYTIKPNIYGGIASRFMKIPYAVNITGLGTAFQKDGFFKKIIIFLYKLSSQKASVIFFENQGNQQLFIKESIVKEKNTYKLNGAGVNLNEYEYCDYPSNSEQIRFLFIGRVMKEKGIDELFEVACRIRKRYDNITFDIVGPIEDNYEEKIMELKEKEIIKYHGFQTDVKKFIKTTNCFVLPSYHEGMANTLLESGAMGRPLITSNIYGCKEAVNNSENGFLVNVGDSDDLYLKIKDFIELPYERKVHMGIKSREHIEKKFNKKLVVKSTLEVLEKKIGIM